jgi:hypothetical protein
MKKFIALLVVLVFFASPAYSMTFGDDITFEGPVYFQNTVQFGDTAYTLPSTDGTVGQHLATNGSGTLSWAAAGSTTAWDDIADPDAAGTIAFTTFAQLITSTKTDGDMINVRGIGAFADVSVMRVEQITGNPTDGTVLEVVAADANVDPLVVSSSGLANALVVGQNAGATTVNGALTANSTVALGDGGDTVAINSSDWDITTAGAVSGIASVTFDNGTGLYQTDVTVTAAEMKGVRAAPKTLIAGVAGSIIEFVSVVIVMDYGSEVLTESADNLVIEYEDGRDITAAIETTGFIDQTADQVAIINAADVPTMTAAAAVNKAVQLFNTGDGEIGGNASDDTSFSLKITYRLHTVSL